LCYRCGAFAQLPPTAAIGGTALDTSRAAVPNAKVTVKNTGTNAEEIVMTDDTGYFRVGKLQAATYSVSVERRFRPIQGGTGDRARLAVSLTYPPA